jgi:hypothetical protein
VASFFSFSPHLATHTARTRGPLALIRGLVRRGDERCRVRSTWYQAKGGCSSLRLNHGSDIRICVAAVFGAVCLMDCRVQVVVGLLEGDSASVVRRLGCRRYGLPGAGSRASQPVWVESSGRRRALSRWWRSSPNGPGTVLSPTRGCRSINRCAPTLFGPAKTAGG